MVAQFSKVGAFLRALQPCPANSLDPAIKKMKKKITFSKLMHLLIHN
jgi:hypothetical protein